MSGRRPATEEPSQRRPRRIAKKPVMPQRKPITARPQVTTKTRPPAAPPHEPPTPKPKPRVRPEPIRPEQFLWAYPPEPPYTDEARPVKNAPAVDSEGRIYFCTQDRVVALKEEEGKPEVLWEYAIGGHVPGPVVVAPDGTIRVHSIDGLLHGVTAAGKQAWSPVRVGEPLGWASPVVDQAGNTYISAYDGGLIRVSPDGRAGLRRYFPSRRKLDSAGIIHDGLLLIGSEEGYVFAIRLGTDEGINTWDHIREKGYAGGFVNSSPAVTDDGGTIIVAARDESVYAFAPDGTTTWTKKVTGQILGSPVIGPEGDLYVGTTIAERGKDPRGLLTSIDGNSHQTRWQYDAAGPVESTPVIGDDGVIYLGDNSGTIHALDPKGKVQWTAKVETAIRSPGTILAPECLAFGLDDDTLVVLKCSSKSLADRGWPKIARSLGQAGTSR